MANFYLSIRILRTKRYFRDTGFIFGHMKELSKNILLKFFWCTWQSDSSLGQSLDSL